MFAPTHDEEKESNRELKKHVKNTKRKEDNIKEE